MEGYNFIFSYVRQCASGNLALSECGPVWQLGIIAALLTIAIMFLVLPRILPQRQSTQS